MMTRVRMWAIRCLMVLLIPAVAFGQAAKESGGESAPKRRPAWLELAQNQMKECSVVPTDKPERAYVAELEPVFHHVQSVRGKSVGSVFLWMEESGRPAAVGDVFFLPSKMGHKLYNEWHSLAAVPITVKWGDQMLMSSAVPGLKWSVIPNAGKPADSAAQRERQIRLLARRFTGHLIGKNGDKYELRLLTTPLKQYHAKDSTEFLSGGLFAFCQETDPEIFLLIEARPSDLEPRWMFAVAEFSNLSLFLQLDGQEVWKADPPQFDSRGPHIGGALKEVVLPTEPRETESKP